MENMMKINGTLMEMSTNDGGDLIGKFLVCPLDEANANKVGLKKEDLSEPELLGLKHKALVTKVITNKNGELDFSGHNRKIKTVIKDGEVCNEVEFDTSGIGFHSEVYLEELTLPSGLVKECIVAEAVIWSRYEKVCDVINRLGTNLKTSWEIAYGESYVENGVKWLKNISWLGNCLLGSNVTPAYRDAGMLEVAEDELSLEIAFSEDIKNIKNENGGKTMDKENKIEVAQLSMGDLESRIRRAIYATEGEGRYYWGVLIYPMENVAYAKLDKCCGESKVEDYTMFTYAVNSDDTVSITGQQDVQMVFVAKEVKDTELAEKDAIISEVKVELEKKETEIAESADRIIKLGETIAEKDTIIAEKDTVISELEPFKTQVEEIENAKKETEIAEKKEALKEKAMVKFTAEELETSEELKEAIDNLDETKVKTMVAERVFEEVEKAKKETKAEVEVSEIKKEVKINTENVTYSYEKGQNPIFSFINK